MNRRRKRILALLLILLMLPVRSIAASAEEAEQTPADLPETQTEESLIDEAELTQWMDSYLERNGVTQMHQRFSVGFYYSATGESWYYNADEWMYSASLYKVPVAMLMAEKEAAGELTQDSEIANQHGGGTLQYLESSALTLSNNDSGHTLVEYLGGTYLGKCSDMTIKYTDLPEDYFNEDFYDVSYYTARYMTQVMATLLEGGEEKFPHVIEYLLPAQPDGYLNLSLKGKYEVAQKYGAYEEPNGRKNNHIAAIVYTPTPIVVTVMTRYVDDYQLRMAEVGAYLADYSLKLDSLREEKARTEEEAVQPAETTPAPEAVTESPAETAVITTETARPENTVPQKEAERFPIPMLVIILILAGVAVVVTALAASAVSRKNRKHRKRAKAKTVQREEKADTGYRPRH